MLIFSNQALLEDTKLNPVTPYDPRVGYDDYQTDFVLS